MAYTWVIFETIGTVAFAFSGALVGLSKRMDVFGITVLAVLTAVGGGMLRDTIIGFTPPSALIDIRWIAIAVGVSLFVCVGYRLFHFSRREKKVLIAIYNVSDLFGLASFAVTGATLALRVFPERHVTLPVLLGLLTAVGGGVMRDLLAQRVPIVLRADFYAMAAILGSLFLSLLWRIMPHDIAAWMAFFFVVVLRACALRYGWQLYHPASRRGCHPDGGLKS